MTTTTTLKSIWLLAILLVTHLGIAQSSRYYFDHLTTEEGLSQNDVNCILQDRTGFMWFGTNDGLNLYDGYGFKVFKPKVGDSSAIISNRIQALEEDHLGRIWVGTAGEGISCFLPKYERFVNLKEVAGVDMNLSSDFIVDLFIDQHNRLWVCTSKGVSLFQLSDRYEMDNTAISNISTQLLPKNVRQMRGAVVFEDDDHSFWVGFNAALFHLEEKPGQEAFFVTPIIRQGSKGIVRGRDGDLLVGTNKGLFQIIFGEANQLKVNKIDKQSHEHIVYNDGTIWTSSRHGLTKFVYHPQKEVPVKEHTYVSDLSDSHSLTKTVLRTIYADRNGIIWIGTNGGGVNKFEPKQKTFFHYKETMAEGSLSYDKVRSIYEDSYQNLWIGTEGGGINFLPATDSAMNSYRTFSHLDQPGYVFALSEYECKGEKYMLLGGQARPGLYQTPIKEDMQSLSGLSISPYPQINSSVFAILNIDNCDILVGTYHQGIFRLDAQNQRVAQQLRHMPGDASSLSSDLTRSLMQDREGNIWIGTGRGLNCLKAEELHLQHPTFDKYFHEANDPTSISHDYILALFQSRSGDIWVGTFGGGLNKFVPASQDHDAYFISYTEKDGLPNNVIKGILEDDEGYLWLSTNKGLSRFSPETGTFYNFDTKDGLQSDEFSELAQFRRKNGDMIFGGVNGINVFKSSSFQINPNPPQVVITDFQVLNKSVAVGEEFNHRVLLDQSISYTSEIHLKHHENSFSLGFSGFHYRAPIKNKYAFKLEGFHTDWVYVGADKRFVNFTNLDPGTYVFKVKAANSDGIWTETPTQIIIHISPPFWLTWWAFLLYAVLLIGMIWLLAHYTFIGIREKHQLMLEHLEKEKSEELQQMKLEFFTNISHELRTPLSLISGPMDYLIQSGKGLSYELRERQYQLIRKNAEYLLRLANQLLDFRKVDQGIVKLQVHQQDIVSYVREISEPFQFIARKQQISFKVHAHPGEIPTWYDPDVIEKVIYNLLSNAFKYTPTEGEICVEIKKKEEKDLNAKSGVLGEVIEIRVRDTGTGVPKKDREKIFHRFYKGAYGQKNNAVGVGIGLSYTKELVKLHHGSIWVEDNQPKGACFVVVLPKESKAYSSQEKLSSPLLNLNLPSKPSIEPIISSLVPEMGSTIDETALLNGEKPEGSLEETPVAHPPTMLIIDDNLDIRTFLKEAFSREYQILEAADGEAGWKLALAYSPDLILSDVMMPKMNGVELCNKVKEDQRTSHIPIVLLTAKTTEESELEGLKNGADAYIRKPFRLEILKYKIANILATREELQKRFRREVILEPKEVTLNSADEIFLQKTMDLIEENMTEPDFNVEAMVKEIGMSRSKLYLKLKALTGQSSSEFIRTVRLKRAAQLLESSGLTVKEIMYMTGFNTASYFSKCFKKQFGVVPSEYVRRKNPVTQKPDVSQLLDHPKPVETVGQNPSDPG